MQEKILSFLLFHLDLANEQLWRDEQLIALRPKTFAVLRYLVEHAGRLVTKDELLHAVWGDTQVSDEGVRDYIRELRSVSAHEWSARRSTLEGRMRAAANPNLHRRWENCPTVWLPGAGAR